MSFSTPVLHFVRVIASYSVGLSLRSRMEGMHLISHRLEGRWYGDLDARTNAEVHSTKVHLHSFFADWADAHDLITGAERNCFRIKALSRI